MGLNDSFYVRAQIFLTNPLPSINKVFSLIIQEERQGKISISSFNHDTCTFMTRTLMPNPNASSMPNPHEPIAFMTKITPAGPRFAKQNFRKDRPICSQCGVAGHTIEKCYKVHGYPPGFKFTRNKPNQFVQHSSNQVQRTNLTNFHQLNNIP